MADIQITNSGSGFFSIHGLSPTGTEWINSNVDGASNGQSWSDDVHYTKDIYQGALDDGLEVE